MSNLGYYGNFENRKPEIVNLDSPAKKVQTDEDLYHEMIEDRLRKAIVAREKEEKRQKMEEKEALGKKRKPSKWDLRRKKRNRERELKKLNTNPKYQIAKFKTITEESEPEEGNYNQEMGKILKPLEEKVEEIEKGIRVNEAQKTIMDFFKVNQGVKVKMIGDNGSTVEKGAVGGRRGRKSGNMNKKDFEKFRINKRNMPKISQKKLKRRVNGGQSGQKSKKEIDFLKKIEVTEDSKEHHASIDKGIEDVDNNQGEFVFGLKALKRKSRIKNKEKKAKQNKINLVSEHLLDKFINGIGPDGSDSPLNQSLEKFVQQELKKKLNLNVKPDPIIKDSTNIRSHHLKRHVRPVTTDYAYKSKNQNMQNFRKLRKKNNFLSIRARKTNQKFYSRDKNDEEKTKKVKKKRKDAKRKTFYSGFYKY